MRKAFQHLAIEVDDAVRGVPCLGVVVEGICPRSGTGWPEGHSNQWLRSAPSLALFAGLNQNTEVRRRLLILA